MLEVVLFGLAVVGILIFVAIFASVLAQYNPYIGDMTQGLQPPSWQHLLGTDLLGRDELSRLIDGS
jgi:ABC-type dipeptide/oligopeptide/nickel transport system permease subunit